MNDTNNNLNGTVLGSVNNSNANPVSNDNIEMLDFGVPSNNGITNENTNTYNNQNVNTDNELAATNIVEQPMPQVEPAYTSLQSINPAPMPGFEDSSVIGTTPPISLEPEKQPKKKKTNKVLFIILVLIVLAGVGFGTYYVLNFTDILNKESEIKINVKDLEINLGDKLSDDISDYAKISGTDEKNCSVDKTDINNNEVGEYKFTVTCGKEESEGKVVVVDNKKNEVNTKIVYKVIGEELKVEEFIEDLNADYKYEFVDNDNIQSYLNAEGTYEVKIKISDKNKKENEISAKLVVLKYAIKGFLTCSSNGQNIEDSSAVITHSIKSAISKNELNENIFGKVAYEIYSYKYSDETEYANLLAEYRSQGKITINNVSGKTEFNDETLTITISNDKELSELNSQYGESNFEKYSTIKSYFESTKGYSCVYKNESSN